MARLSSLRSASQLASRPEPVSVGHARPGTCRPRATPGGVSREWGWHWHSRIQSLIIATGREPARRFAVVIPRTPRAELRCCCRTRAVLDARRSATRSSSIAGCATRELADTYRADLLTSRTGAVRRLRWLPGSPARTLLWTPTYRTRRHIHDLGSSAMRPTHHRSRYVPGGHTLSFLRAALSRILNLFFSRGRTPQCDMSSGLALQRRAPSS